MLLSARPRHTIFYRQYEKISASITATLKSFSWTQFLLVEKNSQKLSQCFHNNVESIPFREVTASTNHLSGRTSFVIGHQPSEMWEMTHAWIISQVQVFLGGRGPKPSRGNPFSKKCCTIISCSASYQISFSWSFIFGVVTKGIPYLFKGRNKILRSWFLSHVLMLSPCPPLLLKVLSVAPQ